MTCHAFWLRIVKLQLCAGSILSGDHRHSYLRQHALRRMREYLDCLDTWNQSCIKDSANPTAHSCWAGGISCLLSKPGYKVQVRMEEDSVSCLFSYCGTTSQRKTQNAPCVFCNSLICGCLFILFFLEYKSESAPTQTSLDRAEISAQWTCQVFWTKLNKSELLPLNVPRAVRPQQSCLFEKYMSILRWRTCNLPQAGGELRCWT